MEIKQKNNMKPAILDHIILWMILFVSFVILLFIVIDYSAVVRVKNNTDILAHYGARMAALGADETDIATKLNNIKIPYFDTIVAADVNCTTSIPAADEEYQIVFTVTSNYNDAKLLTITDDITSRVATFNERSSDYITCDLDLRKN